MSAFFLSRHFIASAAMVIIFSILGVLTAQATISRVNSLGGNGDFFEDDSNVLRWYGSLVDYPNQAVLESGNFNIQDGYWQTPASKLSGPGFGVHYALGQSGQYGNLALFYRDHNDDRNFSMISEELRNNVQLIYALNLGPLTAAAFWGHGSRDLNIANTEFEYSANNVGLGARLDLNENVYLDLAWESQFTSLQNSSFPETDEPESESNYNLRGRAFIALGDHTALVPMAEILHEDRLHPFISPINLENRLTRLGCGLNYYPDTDHLLILSTEYVDGRQRTIYTNYYFEKNYSTWTCQAGFESRMLSWLTARGSVSGTLDHQFEDVFFDGDQLNELPPPSDPTMRVNLGFSLHLGPGDLDMNFGEQYPESVYVGQQPEPQKPWLSFTARLFF